MENWNPPQQKKGSRKEEEKSSSHFRGELFSPESSAEFICFASFCAMAKEIGNELRIEKCSRRLSSHPAPPSAETTKTGSRGMRNLLENNRFFVCRDKEKKQQMRMKRKAVVKLFFLFYDSSHSRRLFRWHNNETQGFPKPRSHLSVAVSMEELRCAWGGWVGGGMRNGMREFSLIDSSQPTLIKFVVLAFPIDSEFQVLHVRGPN